MANISVSDCNLAVQATQTRSLREASFMNQSHKTALHHSKRLLAGKSLASMSLLLLTLLAVMAVPACAIWGGQNSAADDIDAEMAAGYPNFGSGHVQESSADSNQKRISAMNVLLPISDCAECRKVQFELSASNGCYTW